MKVKSSPYRKKITDGSMLCESSDACMDPWPFPPRVPGPRQTTFPACGRLCPGGARAHSERLQHQQEHGLAHALDGAELGPPERSRPGGVLAEERLPLAVLVQVRTRGSQ